MEATANSAISALKLDVGVQLAIDLFVQAAQRALGDQLRALVLFGSAARGELRATSDVNVVAVLTGFDAAYIDGLREAARTAHATIRLEVMLLLEGELAEAMEAFPEKFADIQRARVVLFGGDPFAQLRPSRSAELRRLRQVLLNLVLRLRQRYVLASLREEQAAKAVAEFASPVRACAALWRELAGLPPLPPKQALAAFAEGLNEARWVGVLVQLSEARESRLLAEGAAAHALFSLLELTSALHSAALALPEEQP